MAKAKRLALVVKESARAELAVRETRRRKKLGDVKAGFSYEPPLFELRVGEIRVVYTVDDESRTVTVHAVRRKPPEMTTEDMLR